MTGRVNFRCLRCSLEFWVAVENLNYKRHIECPNCENSFLYTDKLTELLANATKLFQEIHEAGEAWSLKVILKKE